MGSRQIAVLGSCVLHLRPHGHARGRFARRYKAETLAGATKIRAHAAQIDHSFSPRGVLRAVDSAPVPSGQARSCVARRAGSSTSS